MSTGLDLVLRFAGVLRSGQLEELDDLLAEDCLDQNPMPFQPPGRLGVAFKLALFHAQHPCAHSTFTKLSLQPGKVIAEWTTTFAGGLNTRWRGNFYFLGERIITFRTAHVE